MPFAAWMQERGLDDWSLIETIRSDLLAARAIEAIAETAEEPSIEQLESYYAAHRDEITIGEQVRLRIIAVESAQAAQEALTALEDGANFPELARRQSLGSLASAGGDTGWVELGTLAAPLRDAVEQLSIGQAVGPLRKSDQEYLVVALEGRRALPARKLNEVRPIIESQLRSVNRQKAIQQWLAAQRAQADIEVFR